MAAGRNLCAFFPYLHSYGWVGTDEASLQTKLDNDEELRKGDLVFRFHCTQRHVTRVCQMSTSAVLLLDIVDTNSDWNTFLRILQHALDDDTFTARYCPCFLDSLCHRTLKATQPTEEHWQPPGQATQLRRHWHVARHSLDFCLDTDTVAAAGVARPGGFHTRL